jgi:hypothetical protein
MTTPTQPEQRRIHDPHGFEHREHLDDPFAWRTDRNRGYDVPPDSSGRLDAIYTSDYSRVPTYASVPRKIEYPDTDAVTVREVVDETTSEEIRRVVAHAGGRP